MRYLFLVLALGFGLSAQRAPAQTVAQDMTFSIICQYATNIYSNTDVVTGTTTKHQQIVTVLLDTANIAKAIALDLEGTNWDRGVSGSTDWAGAAIVYEQNMINSNQAIFLRVGGKQTNVSRFFTNNSSTNAFGNMFSQTVGDVFIGTNYATLPLLGGYTYNTSGNTKTNDTAIGNLAYLTFSSTNTSFALFGFSQGTLIDVFGFSDHTLYSNQVEQALINAAGTFSLNLTTNIYTYLTNTPPYSNNPSFFVLTNYTGIAHGTINVNQPYFLNIEGP
jgi:hypothetical protein